MIKISDDINVNDATIDEIIRIKNSIIITFEDRSEYRMYFESTRECIKKYDKIIKKRDKKIRNSIYNYPDMPMGVAWALALKCGITTMEELLSHTVDEVSEKLLMLDGIGPKKVQALIDCIHSNELKFKGEL